MKFSNLFSYSTLFLLTISTTLLLSACGNPAGSDEDEHEEEHSYAVGAVLKVDGTEIVRYDDTGLTGQIEVIAGNETSLITIYFLDEHGEEFQPEEPENSLGWREIDETIAEIEQHAEDGKWSFHVHGVAQGAASVIFELKHGDHADFETPEIPVIVN